MVGGIEKYAFFNGKQVISRKRWEIQPRLLILISKKYHAPYQMRWKALTLNDLEGRYALLWL